MSSKVKIGILALMLVVASGAFAASAYTSGSVDRSANVNVVNDDVGLIALQPGTPGGLVYQNTSGALAIDFAAGGASGANTEAHFEIGDTASANTTYAFNITNLDAESHDFTVSYSGNDSNTASNIEFQVYDSAGATYNAGAYTADEEGNSASLSGVASGETLYVVIVVDTHGLDSTADLSGTLTISA